MNLGVAKDLANELTPESVLHPSIIRGDCSFSVCRPVPQHKTGTKRHQRKAAAIKAAKKAKQSRRRNR